MKSHFGERTRRTRGSMLLYYKYTVARVFFFFFFGEKKNTNLFANFPSIFACDAIFRHKHIYSTACARNMYTAEVYAYHRLNSTNFARVIKRDGK